MKNFKYVIMVLAGGALYGTMSSIVKLSYAKGFNAAEISFAQALLAAFFMGICVFRMRMRKRRKLGPKTVLSLLLTGTAIGLTNYLYYLSVSRISASLAIVILMQFVWFGLVIEWRVFGRVPMKPELSAVAFILMGSVLAADPFSLESVSFDGTVYALAASVSYSIYIVANARVGSRVQWQIKGSLIMAGSALTIFFINCNTIVYENHFGLDFLPWALVLAILGTTIPTAMFAIGIPRVGAGLSSILMSIELPVAVLCAHFVLNESIAFIQVLGVIVMLLSISSVNYYRSKASARDRCMEGG